MSNTNQPMKNKEKIVITLIVGWSTIHVILYQSIKNYNGRRCLIGERGKFWPIDDGILKCSYDETEFLIYVLTPIIMYVVYKLLSLIKTKTNV